MRTRWLLLLAAATSSLVCVGCSDDSETPSPQEDASVERDGAADALADGRIPDVSLGEEAGADAHSDEAAPDGGSDADGGVVISDASDEPDGYPPLPNLAGHALLPTSDGVAGTQVLDWEAATQGVFNRVQFDAKDIVVFGKRGIVRYLDVERGIVFYPDEGYNYVQILQRINVNPSAVPPGFSLRDAGVADAQSGASADAEASPDAAEGGAGDAGTPPPYSTYPIASVPVPTGSDFVFSRERNDIVIVTREGIVTFYASGTYDLSSFNDPADQDGKIDPVDALYDPSTGWLFGLLARIDRTKSTWPEGLPSCDGPTPMVFALQPVLKSMVDLSPLLGTPTISLLGRAPVSIELEPDSERIFVLSAGCIGEGGAVEKRGIEMFDVAKGTHEWALDLNAMPRPTRLMMSPILGHAFVQFEDHSLFRWHREKKVLEEKEFSQLKNPPYPLAPLAGDWIVGFEPGKTSLVLMDAWYEETYLRDRTPVSLPNAVPHGQGYGWP